MDFVRTPDECFTDLPDWPFEPSYADVAPGLRMAWHEAGPADGPVIVCLHGNPSWSYLYRRMLPIFAAAGYRAIAPDLIGFGRSDKPTAIEDYTYAAHVEWVRELLFDRLDLREVTLVGQDWGGAIGIRLVAEHPDRFAAVVAANTILLTGEDALGEAFDAYLEFAMTSPVYPVGLIVRGANARPVPDEVVAAYDAPFPDQTFQAGARAFTPLVPISTGNPAVPANLAAWERLEQWTKPWLNAYSDGDPITAPWAVRFAERIPGAAGQPHVTIEGAGHFLQEDRGEELATVVVEWLAGQSTDQSTGQSTG